MKKCICEGMDICKEEAKRSVSGYFVFLDPGFSDFHKCECRPLEFIFYAINLKT
jgi:hypothetical protein